VQTQELANHSGGGRAMTDKEKLLKLRKLADAMYYSAQYLTTVASKLHKAMDEYHQFIINEYHKEEPSIPDIVDEHYWEMLGEDSISEDMWEASKQYALRQVFASTDAVMTEQAYLSLKLFSGFEIAVAHKDGANWQRQQMMKNAKDGVITFDYYGDNDKIYGCIAHDSFSLEELGLKDGDKVKLIIIKEDEQ
jgi:hypothetical protein